MTIKRTTQQPSAAKKVSTAKNEKATPKAESKPVANPAKSETQSLSFQDPLIDAAMKQLVGDAATMERILPQLDEKVLVIGTARSRNTPGANGAADYVWGVELGKELRKADRSVGTGAGPGAMEAPLVGHYQADEIIKSEAKRKGETVESPDRQGAQIILPHEQASNPYIPEQNQGKFDRFLFRMETLFRNTSDLITTPGGYGTVAEVFAFMAQKSHGQHNDPIVFGAPDDFFTKFNAAFEPLLNDREKPDLKNVYNDPAKLVASLGATKGKDREDIPALLKKMTDQLEVGMRKIDGKPPVVAFFGGAGKGSEAMAPVAQEIATAMAKKGTEMRVGGSPFIDKAVLAGARKVNPDAEVQAFAMADAPVESSPGLDYTKVDDVLVLRELMNTNLKGIVVSPEGAKQIALLFTAACDMQTGEMPKVPIIVLDPEGKFAEVKKMLKETMLSDTRKYINPEDLDLFTVTTSAKEAIKLLNKTPAPKPAEPVSSAPPVLPTSFAESIRKSAILPDEMIDYLSGNLNQQLALSQATAVMEAARTRISEAFARGESPLAEIDRTALPKTEDEAVQYLMDRVGLTAQEQVKVRRGIEALANGAQLSKRGQPIGGHSSKYAETFRTKMAVTDPGIDHIAMVLADPRLLNGTFVHKEIIDRPTEHTAPYSNPGATTIALIRLLTGDDAPSTVFYGRPNYMASIKQDSVEGTDDVASAGLKFNPLTAANQLSNAARGLFNQGVSEVKVTMDGLSPDEVKAFGQLTHAQARPLEGEYISAAFNLNAILRDFNLRPADAAPITGAPTPEQRNLMLQGSLQSIDVAKEAGFKKVTVDSASMTPPSYPLIEYFGVENILDWAHHAHEVGLETYGSGGMRDYHFPLLQFVGLDGVGVGFSIHDTNPENPALAGRLLPEKVLSALDARDKAEVSPVGRASVLLRMLDEKASDGSVTKAQDTLRGDIHSFLKGMAKGIDAKLDVLKATRDTAAASANALTDPEAKKTANAAARKTFEDGFKALIASALQDPQAVEKATALLAKGDKLKVQA
jgi:predicted Rossmann-fold nucleotide-binding protein